MEKTACGLSLLLCALWFFYSTMFCNQTQGSQRLGKGREIRDIQYPQSCICLFCLSWGRKLRRQLQ